MSQINEIEIGGKVYSIAGGEGGSSSLTGLSDVELDATLSEKQVLTYDAENEKWVNADATGGTEVVPNPEEEATDSLKKIQIDDVVYSIEGGTTEEIDANKVNFNTTETTYFSKNVQRVLENLNKGYYDADYYIVNKIGDILRIEQYNALDELLDFVEHSTTLQIRLTTFHDLQYDIRNTYQSIRILVNSNGKNIIYNNTEYKPSEVILYMDNASTGTFDNIKLQAVGEVNSGASFINYVNNGSGLEATNVQNAIDELANNSSDYKVIPNPEEEATEDLKKIKIGENTYSIPTGSSPIPTGSGKPDFVELYSGEVITGTITLEKSIRDFDYIYFEGTHSIDNKYRVNKSHIYNIDEIEYGDLIGIAYDSGYLWYRVDTDTTFIFYGNSKFTNFKVFGIKFNGCDSSSHTYSEEEQIVGKWIDGKPIYEISYYNEEGLSSYSIDASELNIKYLVKLDGFGYGKSDTFYKITLNPFSINDIHARYNENNKMIEILNCTAYKLIGVTFQYIKNS